MKIVLIILKRVYGTLMHQKKLNTIKIWAEF